MAKIISSSESALPIFCIEVADYFMDKSVDFAIFKFLYKHFVYFFSCLLSIPSILKVDVSD